MRRLLFLLILFTACKTPQEVQKAKYVRDSLKIERAITKTMKIYEEKLR